MATATKAAAYVRMSTDEQAASPEQQRDAVQAYAKDHRFKITKWFEDLGISGDKTDKRIGFQRMMAEACSGSFDTILVWDQDRFGRFDSMEFNYWAHQLRQHSVSLVTVTDGLIDWSEMAGRMMGNIKQEGKHQYLRDLSKNVSRGMEKLAGQGKWVTGRPPFGYVVDEERYLQLGDPEEVAVVQEIFSRYLAGESTRMIAGLLSERGIASPKGGKWTATGIKHLLKNERYCGYMVYNQRSSSKYKDPTNPKGVFRTQSRDKWTIVQDTHPAIVSSADFEKVQQLMQSKNKKRRLMPESTNALSGLLRCGSCGAPMHCGKENGVPSYTCQSYWTRTDTCERFNVKEQEALRAILTALRTEYFDRFTPETMDALRRRMKDLINGNRAASNVVKGHLRKVEAQLEKASRRLLEVDVDMVHIVQDRIRELEDQRDTLKAQIDDMSLPADEQTTAAEKRLKAAMAWLGELEREVDADYDSAKVNAMLRQFVDKVEIHMERVPIGSKGYHRCVLTGGVVYFAAGKISRFVDNEPKAHHLSVVNGFEIVAICWGSAKAA